MNYLGDLNNQSALTIPRLAGGIGLRYRFDNRWAFRAEVNYGSVACEKDYIELRNLASLEQATQEIGEKYPELSLLVNNAGIPGDMSVDSQHTVLNDIQETLNVNFIGTFALTKALMPLLTQNTGRIVNVTVPSEISPYWHPLAYVASKAAQNAMMGVMAIEFQQHNTPLEIFSVHPGPTTTDLNGNMSLPGFHDIDTVGEKMAELINDGQSHQGEFVELYPIVKED